MKEVMEIQEFKKSQINWVNATCIDLIMKYFKYILNKE